MEEDEVITLDSLATLASGCNAELEEKFNTVHTFIERLSKGVSPLVGSKIIDEIWGTSNRGKAIKLKLSGFESNNGRAILGNDLTKAEVANIYQEKIIDDYFTKITCLVEILADQLLLKIKGAEFTEENQARYNEARKNILTYIDFISPYRYYHDVIEKHGALATWEDVAFESARVADGDYLFYDSFKKDLVKAHQDFSRIEIALQDQKAGFYSFYNLKHHLERIRISITIPFIFASYLQSTLNDLN